MNRFFDSIDPGMFGPPDLGALDEALDGATRAVSELLILYFACRSGDPDGFGYEETSERIALAISDLADDGDEDAMMAMAAISALTSYDAPDEDLIVGVAMLNAVVSRPVLRSVIEGDVDNDAAAGALRVIMMLCDELLEDVGGGDYGDDDDPDDVDLARLAAELGVTEFDLDFEGGFPDDR